MADSIPQVTKVEEVTKFPEMLDGRVKTLHPAVHGGILAKRGDASHMQAIESHSIGTIDIVVVNLYPFRATVTATNKPSFDTVRPGTNARSPDRSRG